MKKNIVHIFCDELRPDALGCYGNPFFRPDTPNIDMIAEHGTLFEDCMCNSPVCVPSRASILTALYPEETGIYDNEAAYPQFHTPGKFMTFPEVLAENGYLTASFGKTHIPQDMKPFWFENQEGSDMTLGLTREQIRSLEKVSPKNFGFNAASLYPEDLPYQPEKVTENALEWMKEHENDPYYIRISILQPHTPIILKRGYEKVYEDAALTGDLPDTSHLSEFEKAFAKAVGIESITPENRRKMKIYYYGLVKWIDDEVGKVLAYLKDSGLLEKTILAVGADHGALRGECRGLGKHIFHKASQAVPLIISDGWQAEGKRVSGLCSNIDFARTILETADVPVPDQFHGVNLLKDELPGEVYSTKGFGDVNCYAFPNRMLGTLSETEFWPRRTCIRTGNYRLDMNIRINGRYCTPEQEDIFFTDCSLYPDEDMNLADREEYQEVIRELREKVLAHSAGALEVPANMIGAPVKRAV